MPIKYSTDSYKKLFYSIFLLYEKFGSNLVIYKIVKVFLNRIAKPYLRVRYFLENLPASLILERDFDFLQKFFEDEFIFLLILEYLIDPRTFISVTDFYFKNNLHVKYPEKRDKIIRQFAHSTKSKINSGDHAFKQNFEYFIKMLCRANSANAYDKLYLDLFVTNCFVGETSNDYIKLCELHIEKNLSKIIKNLSQECAKIFINLLNGLKQEKREDDLESYVSYQIYHTRQ